MQTQRLTFLGATGENLSARLELPLDGRPMAYALFAHCFTCSKNYKAVVHISRALARARIGVLRFDFTGLGESEGDFSDTTFSSNVEDLVAAAAYMERELTAPAILIGHSLGAAAVLQAAHHISACRAVVTIAAPAELRHVMRHLKSSIEQLQEYGSAEVTLAGRTFTLRKKFLDDLDRQNMEEVIATLDRALLIFHSPADTIVGAEDAARIYETAREPKSYVSLDGADHLLSRPEDSQYVGAVIAAWATRYLKVPAEGEPEEAAPRGQAVVRTGQDRYHTDILIGPHSLVADEPESVGGTDAGPTPTGLLVAALGACTTITLRMYADRKQWPLEEIGVRLQHKKMKTGEPKTTEISQTLELVGPLSAEQRERLLQIAQRCPVHRALETGVAMPMSLEP
jgi:uncharacterized OsmC-like protein/alpha/beta superfamily hydrolase